MSFRIEANRLTWCSTWLILLLLVCSRSLPAWAGVLQMTNDHRSARFATLVLSNSCPHVTHTSPLKGKFPRNSRFVPLTAQGSFILLKHASRSSCPIVATKFNSWRTIGVVSLILLEGQSMKDGGEYRGKSNTPLPPALDIVCRMFAMSFMRDSGFLIIEGEFSDSLVPWIQSTPDDSAMRVYTISG